MSDEEPGPDSVICLVSKPLVLFRYSQSLVSCLTWELVMNWLGLGKMAWWLAVLAALAEDPGSAHNRTQLHFQGL